ncbi:MAG: QueG-associated DUF1730 domain-containing protein [Acidaminobacteraceae bacterium]
MELEKFIDVINIPVYGVTNKLEYFDISDDLNKYNKDNPLEFCSDMTKERLSSNSVLKDVKSIITILIPYELESNISRNDVVDIVSIVSNNAWEIDYHSQLKEKLLQIAEYLRSFFDDLEYECVVDTSPLIDRRIAYECSLGCYGKNTFLINETLGTAFYIGSLLVNKRLSQINILKAENIEYNTPKEISNKKNLYRNCSICADCDLCVKHCPGNALDGKYTIDSNKCISYLTQKKGILSYDERKLISNRLYGCDICQKVCPYNNTDFEIAKEYRRTSSNVVDAIELIKTSNKQLRKIYRTSGFIWRGPNILKRNALINIGNSKNKYGLKFLTDYYFELSIDNRLYGLWAIYNINVDDFRAFIENNDDRFSDKEKIEVEKLFNINS